MKRFGGHFNSVGHHIDGDKYICLDSFIQKEHCTVYSFGISTDWSFDDMVADRLGIIATKS